MSETKDKILFSFHLVVFVLTAYFLWWGMFAAPSFELETVFQLTFITQETLFCYYLWALKRDYDNISSETKKHQRYPDAAHTLLQLLFPLTCLVSVGYWRMRLKDWHLMISEEGLENPLILCLFNHGINIILCLLEIVFFSQRVVKGFLWKATVIIIATVIYSSIQFVFQTLTGRTIYPFLAALNLQEIASFYVSLAVLMIIVDRINTFMILALHRQSNPKLPKEPETADPKQYKNE